MSQIKFPFTASGIHEWQAHVYTGGQASIDQECQLIASDLTTWMSDRFILTEDQVAFVADLDVLLHQSYAAAIQYALQQHIDIQLDKEESGASRGVKNPKVVIMEEKIERWRNSTKQGNEQTGDHLMFRIFYP